MRPFVLLLACFAAGSAFATESFPARFQALKAAATPRQLYALLYDLPKGGDIHNHAGGSDIPEWIFAIATDPARNGGEVFYTRARIPSAADAVSPAVLFHTVREATYRHLSPAVRAEYVKLTDLTAAERQAWCDSQRLESAGEGRNEFFNAIWARRGDVGRSLPVRLELLAENIKAFAAEGVRYLETQYGAIGLSDASGRIVPTDEAVAATRARLAQPDVASTGLVVRFQETAIRFRPDAETQLVDLHAFVSTYRDLWVGLNMAGLEETGPGYPRRFLETFRRLRLRHPAIPLSIHAGEMDGPNSHVRDTLLLGATRIGHGLNLIHDEELMLLLQQSRRVLVEINLVSNRLLEYTPDYANHPFPEYLRTGIPVCLNTDDRGMWDSNMTDEYFTAVKHFALTWEEIVELGRNSLAFAFVQPEVKARLLADYDARVAAFEKKYAAGSVTDALARLESVRPVAYGYAKRTWSLEFD